MIVSLGDLEQPIDSILTFEILIRRACSGASWCNVQARLVAVTRSLGGNSVGKKWKRKQWAENGECEEEVVGDVFSGVFRSHQDGFHERLSPAKGSRNVIIRKLSCCSSWEIFKELRKGEPLIYGADQATESLRGHAATVALSTFTFSRFIRPASVSGIITLRFGSKRGHRRHFFSPPREDCIVV